jgi:hypothetical protein
MAGYFPHISPNYSFNMSGSANLRHLEILRQFNVPDGLASQCAAYYNSSGSCIFIEFPPNKLMQARCNYTFWEVGYYAGTRSDLMEALKNGELLQGTDTSASGSKLQEGAGRIAGLEEKMAYASFPLTWVLGIKAHTISAHQYARYW